MTPEQALEIFEQVRLQATMTGSNHDAAKKAIEVLGELIAENKNEIP